MVKRFEIEVAPMGLSVSINMIGRTEGIITRYTRFSLASLARVRRCAGTFTNGMNGEVESIIADRDAVRVTGKRRRRQSSDHS